jgi:hypothetical protein
MDAVFKDIASGNFKLKQASQSQNVNKPYSSQQPKVGIENNAKPKGGISMAGMKVPTLADIQNALKKLRRIDYKDA